MKLLELTLESAAGNIALDEALLEASADGAFPDEVLRIWEPTSPIVVLGRSSAIGIETRESNCIAAGVPIIRRCSGGCTIYANRGCLMYAVVLDLLRRPALRAVDRLHSFVMEKIQNAVNRTGSESVIQGICDLTIDNRKVSGNALRLQRNRVLYHGTLVCQEMDLTGMDRYLGWPSREPAYRTRRTHTEFVTHLPVTSTVMARSLRDEWNCVSRLSIWPHQLTENLVHRKYDTDRWNRKI